MALKIRLQRFGARHAPSYRLVVTEASRRRDGRFVEILGYYNPLARGKTPDFKVDTKRTRYWMGVGAKPTETARSLIRRAHKVGSPGDEGATEVASSVGSQSSTNTDEQVPSPRESKAEDSTPTLSESSSQ